MGIRIQQSDWVVDGGTLKKQFGYSSVAGAASDPILQIHIDTTPNTVMGGFHRHIAFLLHPNPIQGDPGFVPAQLARNDSPIDAKIVTVRCGPCSDGSLIIQPVDREGTDAFFETLNACVTMRLTLFDNTGALLQLPIPNDEDFRPAARRYFSIVPSVPSQNSMIAECLKPRGLASRLASRLFGWPRPMQEHHDG